MIRRGRAASLFAILVVACKTYAGEEAPSDDAGSGDAGVVDAGNDANGSTNDAATDGGDASKPRVEKVLAMGITAPLAIAATETDVVFSDDTGFVRRVPIDGGLAATVSMYGGSPRQVAVQGTTVIWGDHTAAKKGLWRFAPSSGELHLAPTLELTAFAPYQGTGWATFSSISTDPITLLDANGNVAGTVNAGTNLYDLVADGPDVLVVASGSNEIGRVSNGTYATVVSGQSDCRALARNADGIYWMNGTTTIRTRTNAGTVGDITSQEVGVHSLAADDTGVYWLTDDSVRHWSPATNIIETLASGFVTQPDDANRARYHRLALNSKYVVWLTASELRRVDK